MRREGKMMERITRWENLRCAYALARKGRHRRIELGLGAEALKAWLRDLQDDLSSGNLQLGPYQCFVVCDPKRRVIHAAPFRERVLHHAIMNVAGPVLERRAIFDSYACRVGKGVHRARERAQRFVRQYSHYLKLDVRKYFDSVDHLRLMRVLEQSFKDEGFLQLVWQIISGYETAPGRGLPIGSLVSQHAANAYLGPLDRYIKEELGCRGYLRYMDDLVLWANSRSTLDLWHQRIEGFLAEELSLELKLARFGRSRDGLHFLGTRITLDAIFPDAKARRRLVRKLTAIEEAYAEGRIEHLELQRRGTALVAALAKTSCSEWRKSHLLQGRDVA